jgi:HD-GYP domain-containing protein (c-di-GMP phosphodiesterase class II)
LCGVAYLFSWFESSERDAIRQLSVQNTQATLAQICHSFQSLAQDRNQSDEPTCLQNRFRKASSGFKPVHNSFVCLIEATDGTIIQHRNLPDALKGNSFEKLEFRPNSTTGPATTLANFFAENPETKNVCGFLTLGDQQWLGSAHFLPHEHGIAVVMQDESARMHQRALAFDQQRTRTLLVAGLLSFIAIAVPIIRLHHNDDQLRVTNDNLERQATHNERELVRTRNAVIFGLAKLAESRDNDTGEHLDRIRSYVEILSNDLSDHFSDIDAEFTRNLSLASSLHDIGKVGIPDSILLKPGRLTPEERSVMQIHTVIGGECLDAIHARLGNNPFMHMARQIAYYHHERWDGNGYPHQLKEEDIPLVARIVAVADVYDALTSKRPAPMVMMDKL